MTTIYAVRAAILRGSETTCNNSTKDGGSPDRRPSEAAGDLRDKYATLASLRN